ncbi:GntR family transcriptional regulator [Amorphus sp. MBR-141]
MAEISRKRRSSDKSNLNVQLVDRISRHLQEGHFEPGDHLSTQSLADQFGTSRTPIQKALGILAKKDVIRRVANRGYFVTENISSPEALKDIGPDQTTQVYFQIANDVMDRNLPEIVSESSLRDRYGLSQVATRNLLARIQQEGWIERRPGYGWQFNEMLTTPDALAQSYRLRLALEPAGLLEPKFQIDTEELDKLEDAERNFLGGGIETASGEQLYERGSRFHETLLAASGNQYMLDTLKRMNKIRRLIVYRTMIDRERYYGQSRDHIEIIALIRRGEMEAASAYMRYHLFKTKINYEALGDLISAKI